MVSGTRRICVPAMHARMTACARSFERISLGAPSPRSAAELTRFRLRAVRRVGEAIRARARHGDPFANLRAVTRPLFSRGGARRPSTIATQARRLLRGLLRVQTVRGGEILESPRSCWAPKRSRRASRFVLKPEESGPPGTVSRRPQPLELPRTGRCSKLRTPRAARRGALSLDVEIPARLRRGVPCALRERVQTRHGHVEHARRAVERTWSAAPRRSRLQINPRAWSRKSGPATIDSGRAQAVCGGSEAAGGFPCPAVIDAHPHAFASSFGRRICSREGLTENYSELLWAPTISHSRRQPQGLHR